MQLEYFDSSIDIPFTYFLDAIISLFIPFSASNETNSRFLSGQSDEHEESLKEASDSLEDNSFIQQKRLFMLPMISMVLLGSYFNAQF